MTLLRRVAWIICAILVTSVVVAGVVIGGLEAFRDQALPITRAELGALGQWLGATGAIGLLGLILLQVREGTKQGRLQALNQRYQDVGNHEEAEARRFVLYILPEEVDWAVVLKNDCQRRKVERVLTSYDRGGTLFHRRLVSRDDIMPAVGVSAARSWCKLRPYVKQHFWEQGNPEYYRYFEFLAKKAKDWWGKKAPKRPLD